MRAYPKGVRPFVDFQLISRVEVHPSASWVATHVGWIF